MKLCISIFGYFILITSVCGLILILKTEITINELMCSIVSELLGKETLDAIIPGLYIKTSLHRPLTVMWFFFKLS